MAEEITTDVDILLLVLQMKKNFRYILIKLNVLNFETKSSLSTTVFMFSTISQILKCKFHVL